MTARRISERKVAVRPVVRQSRPARRSQGLILLGLVLATVVVLGIILFWALQRSSTVATTAPTAIPAATSAVPAGAGAPTQAIAPVTAVHGPVRGIGMLAPTSGSAKTAPATPKVGQAAPDFTWRTVSGQASLKGLRGHVVLLDFFAPWCPACQGEETWIASLLQAYGPQGLSVLGVSASPYGIHYEDQGSEVPISMGDLLSYKTSFHVAYPLVFDPQARVFNLYGGGSSFPSYYIIDRKGIVRFGTTTAVTEATLNQQIQAALS